MNVTTDYYLLLGVKRDASTAQIRECFKKLIRTHHPDVNGGNLGQSDAAALIIVAYQTLCDPVKRRDYDRALESQPNSETSKPSSRPGKPPFRSSNQPPPAARKGAGIPRSPGPARKPAMLKHWSNSREILIGRKKRQLWASLVAASAIAAYALFIVLTSSSDWSNVSQATSNMADLLDFANFMPKHKLSEPAWKSWEGERSVSLRFDSDELLSEALDTVSRADTLVMTLNEQNDGGQAEELKSEASQLHDDVTVATIDLNRVNKATSEAEADEKIAVVQKALNDVRAGSEVVDAEMETDNLSATDDPSSTPAAYKTGSPTDPSTDSNNPTTSVSDAATTPSNP